MGVWGGDEVIRFSHCEDHHSVSRMRSGSLPLCGPQWNTFVIFDSGRDRSACGLIVLNRSMSTWKGRPQDMARNACVR